MDAVFLKIVNMSFSAGWLIIAVVLLRLFLKKAPRRITCLLWALVGLRLICPFSFESMFSLIPSGETVPRNIEMMPHPAVDTGLASVNAVVNPVIERHFTPSELESANPLQIVIPVLCLVWLVGVAAMLVYALVSYIRVRRRVKVCGPVKDNIYACDDIPSPFILGIFRPKIYIPSSLSEDTLTSVLTHENAHLSRRDHLWKPLAFGLLALHWFNPLCWLAYILFCRDIETACDEKVIGKLDRDGKARYSEALLECGTQRTRFAVCPLAFGEVGVKARVKAVLHYKKPALWIVIAAVVLSVVAAVCFMTNPPSEKSLNNQLAYSMEDAIREHNGPPREGMEFCDYKVLGITKHKGQTTVYAWVLWEEYTYEDGELRVVQGSHIPTAITFDTSEPIKVVDLAELFGTSVVSFERKMIQTADGSIRFTGYDVIEYFEPRDGSYYADDIRAKFPWRLWRKAFDDSCVDEQQTKVREKAKKYFETKHYVYHPRETIIWFDGLNGDEIWGDARKITLEEYPGVTFRCDAETMEAVTEAGTVALFGGMPIWNVIFDDLDSDGNREICATVSIGSGIVDTHIVIYDYARGKCTVKADRGRYDYEFHPYVKMPSGGLVIYKGKYGQKQNRKYDFGGLVGNDGEYRVVVSDYDGSSVSLEEF